MLCPFLEVIKREISSSDAIALISKQIIEYTISPSFDEDVLVEENKEKVLKLHNDLIQIVKNLEGD